MLSGKDTLARWPADGSRPQDFQDRAQGSGIHSSADAQPLTGRDRNVNVFGNQTHGVEVVRQNRVLVKQRTELFDSTRQHDRFGGRQAAVARELTKRFEEVRRGTLAELAAFYAANAVRGEVSIVVGPPEEADHEDLDGRLRAALDRNSVKDAAALVAAATGLPRKVVYARALTLSVAERD